MMSNVLFHSLLPSKQDLNESDWYLEIRSYINSDIKRGQTDICYCYLPELPALTQTGLVPKMINFPAKSHSFQANFPAKMSKIANLALARA